MDQPRRRAKKCPGSDRVERAAWWLLRTFFCGSWGFTWLRCLRGLLSAYWNHSSHSGSSSFGVCQGVDGGESQARRARAQSPEMRALHRVSGKAATTNVVERNDTIGHRPATSDQRGLEKPRSSSTQIGTLDDSAFLKEVMRLPGSQ